jgi:hypothetical protein
MEPSKTEEAVRELTLREAKLPEKVRVWRAKLSAKAKQEKRFRFYSLYGLISHPETLRAAWQQVRANGGAAGVDRISFEQIEHQGLEPWLEELGAKCEEKLPVPSGAPGLYTQSKRQTAAPGNPDDTGSSGSVRGLADNGTNL